MCYNVFMEQKDIQRDIHKGHRERITQRFLSNPSGFSDHELLEIVLFPVIPRKDTNALAHRLIRQFGGLTGVFAAPAQDLASVDGVGKRVAVHIAAMGKILGAIKEKEKSSKAQKRFYSFNESKRNLTEYFEGLAQEKLMIFLLDGKHKRLTHLEYDDGKEYGVNGDLPEIARAVALYKPRFALMAHNHPSGLCEPSKEDDFATKKLNAVLSVHGVQLTDHIILCGDKAFSYYVTGRMDYIRECSNPDKLFERIKD